MKSLKFFTTLAPAFVTLIYFVAIAASAIIRQFESMTPYVAQVQSVIWATIFIMPIGWSIGANTIIVESKHFRHKHRLEFNIVSSISLIYSALFVIFNFLSLSNDLYRVDFLEALITGLSIAGFFCIPATFWMAAKRIVDLENKISSNTKGTLFTFLQIVYFPIGIYWLFSRINRIKSLINSDNVETQQA